MRGLFGGQRPNMGQIGSFLLGGTNGLDRRRQSMEEERQRALARQQEQARIQAEDRLRAQLSPADGPMGSGTGAMPGIDQQMAALDEARLLNPAVAEQFAPVVQGRDRRERSRGLFGNDPRAQMLFEGGNQEFMDSIAKQYAPQVVAAGASQVVNGQRTVEQPTFTESGDTTLRRTSAGVDPVFTRTTPSISEQTARITAERPQIANLSQGQQAYGVSPYGEVSPLAQNTTPPAPSPQIVEAQGALATNQNEVIPTLNQMRQALQSGDVITGLGADMRLQAARALAATGNEQARRQVAATEAYRNSSGRLRVGMAKTLGANPSNADILLLEKITAGDIGQNMDSLMATIDQGLQFANQRGEFLQGQIGQPQGQPQQGSSQGQRGPIAVNPQTGQRVQWNGSAWVPI